MSSPHVDRYLDRLERHLCGLDNDQRLAFLRNELGQWLYRYEKFVTKVDMGLETDNEVTTWDYLDTICAINKQLPGA